MATLNTSQRLPVTVNITRADGQPAQVQNMVWASSDETVVVAAMDAGGTTGFVNAVAVSTAPARIVMTADADLGDGVLSLSATSEDITVTQDPATQASNIQITFGAPEAKPAAAAGGAPAGGAPAGGAAPAGPGGVTLG